MSALRLELLDVDFEAGGVIGHQLPGRTRQMFPRGSSCWMPIPEIDIHQLFHMGVPSCRGSRSCQCSGLAPASPLHEGKQPREGESPEANARGWFPVASPAWWLTFEGFGPGLMSDDNLCLGVDIQ